MTSLHCPGKIERGDPTNPTWILGLSQVVSQVGLVGSCLGSHLGL